MSGPLPNTGAPSLLAGGILSAIVIVVGGFLVKFARMGAKSAVTGD